VASGSGTADLVVEIDGGCAGPRVDAGVLDLDAEHDRYSWKGGFADPDGRRDRTRPYGIGRGGDEGFAGTTKGDGQTARRQFPEVPG
jgi:hypothetical protein